MSNANLSDVQIQHLLAAITDDLLTGDGDVDALADRYQISDAELRGLFDLIDRLNHAFVPVQPSQRFVRRLHHDLVGMEPGGVLVRVRKLPARVQLAAGLALVAGFVLLSRRRTGSIARQEKPEHAAAQ